MNSKNINYPDSDNTESIKINTKETDNNKTAKEDADNNKTHLTGTKEGLYINDYSPKFSESYNVYDKAREHMKKLRKERNNKNGSDDI